MKYCSNMLFVHPLSDYDDFYLCDPELSEEEYKKALEKYDEVVEFLLDRIDRE